MDYLIGHFHGIEVVKVGVVRLFRPGFVSAPCRDRFRRPGERIGAVLQFPLSRFERLCDVRGADREEDAFFALPQLADENVPVRISGRPNREIGRGAEIGREWG